MSWLCSCGLLNSGLNEQCAASNQTHFGNSHGQVTENNPDWVMAATAAMELSMTPQEELYAKFYNRGKILVKDMDMLQLREHIDTLQGIAFEARATVSAAIDELKERKAKVSNKEWLVTDSKPDVNVTDAINVVKQRAARMSKMLALTRLPLRK
jgi:hypothetical protein